ncbi:MAG: hypothetical protein K2M97_00870 [Muribaculaceae bacterium]|nr:hypothetical protein [Muribaculaceae bacterium]
MERSDILTRALGCHSQLADFRRRRLRYKRFTYGQQWTDTVTCVDGKVRTERDLATMRGRTPLTNNMIRNLVKTIVGHFRTELRDGGDSDADRTAPDLDEIDARTLEEFLISGMAVQRVSHERRPSGSGIHVDFIPPDRFFFAPFSDPRGTDVEFLGMIHEWSLFETMGRFAGNDRLKAAEIRRIYTSDPTPRDNDRCRVIETWSLEASERLRVHDPLNATMEIHPLSHQPRIDAINRKRARAGKPTLRTRWELHTAWIGRWLTPQGIILRQTEADAHPFAFRLYPMIDGEIHSFVEDVIDQQKYINRLITHVDNMLGTAAKGVLLFPQDQLADDMDWHDVADTWASYDGILPYNPRPGVRAPQQVISNAAPAGAYELLALQMRMMEEVSGVHSAYRGKAVSGSGNSAQLYEAQARNSGVALADLFATFTAFRRARNALTAKKVCPR